MHWVDRGEEPAGLDEIRSRYTPRWTDHYLNKIGTKPPSDHRWTEFKPALIKVFFGSCAYCEERQSGEVDHFQPKSRFPRLVYVWSNWVLACHDCNHAKLNTWPTGGYVDPCAKSISDQPESFLCFDVDSGEIVPKEGLSSARRLKAQTTISDLRLNDIHHLRNRLEWLYLISKAIQGKTDADIRRMCVALTSPKARLSSIARAWLVNQGHL